MSKQPIVIVISDLHRRHRRPGRRPRSRPEPARNFIDGSHRRPTARPAASSFTSTATSSNSPRSVRTFTPALGRRLVLGTESRAVGADRRRAPGHLRRVKVSAPPAISSPSPPATTMDLFWPGVQEDLRAVAGPVLLRPRRRLDELPDGRLRIAHGHQSDLANQFRRWSHPFVTGPDGEGATGNVPRHAVHGEVQNWLEGNHPFADNIKPVSAPVAHPGP